MTTMQLNLQQLFAANVRRHISFVLSVDIIEGDANDTLTEGQ